MFRFSKQPFLGVVFGVAICVAMAAILTGCAGLSNALNPNTGTGNWYLHWTCGTSSQCAADFNGSYGVYQTFSTQAACQNQLNTWATDYIMQPYSASSGIGAWCDQNSGASAAPALAKKGSVVWRERELEKID
jgi:hypothetical protein